MPTKVTLVFETITEILLRSDVKFLGDSSAHSFLDGRKIGPQPEPPP